MVSTPVHKVLYVDDNEDLCYLIRRILEQDGFQVSVAHTVADALKKTNEVLPDVILLDLVLPDIDGLEAIPSILEQLPEIPIVIYSNYGSYKEDFRSWAAEEFVQKGMDFDELKGALMRVIQQRQARI